ncbi:hypothetical protein [Pararhizobium mangrovi]|uniref:Uncharacterized protein n=1 Tax=Pararhizobium mangrovi TaxID=2590452 RepID=A0A506UHL4_9HYPH|nr:hypothetical protein [Pararhizobium mangrovi]TPW32800.1 hypothetical protein FJU11_00820 [Pararhizobium mangrovi]
MKFRLFGALAVFALFILAAASPAAAYSYAAAGKEPLIENREALLSGIDKGDWQSVRKAYAGMKSDIAYLDANEDKGIAGAFDKALAAQKGDVLKSLLRRAYVDEIERRLDGARDQIDDYQNAKVLVVKAQKFYEAMAGDLEPKPRAAVEDGLKRALDAIGNPGLFGVGAKDPDPKALAEARKDVLAALKPSAPEAGSSG